MKHLKSRTILMLTSLLFLHPLLKAQHNTTPKHFVVFDIIVQDTTILNSLYIQFEMCKDDVNTDYTSQKDFYKFVIKKKVTRITLPLTSTINYGKIKPYYFDQLKREKFIENGPPIYIFEQGDHIKLFVTKTKLFFEGEKSEKYNCIQSINSTPIYDRSQLNSLIAQRKYDKMFKVLKTQQDSIFNTKKTALYEYRLRINPEIYNLILADCQAYYYSQLLNIFSVVPNRTKEDNNLLRKNYYSWFGHLNLLGLDQKTLVRSYRICDFLYKKAKFEISFYKSHKPNTETLSFTFEELYKSILEKHNGIIRDKAILLAFNTNMVYKNGKSFLETAYKKMGDNTFRTSIERLINNYSGSVYNYELLDQYGKSRKLSEFRGKLLVLDFWFTGCLPCLQLAKELKPIIRSYEENKNIEFISISVDKNKELWLKSVKEEAYSHRDQINLFTNELGEQHPIIKNYNIPGYPVLFLISKTGEIITTALPRPVAGKPESIEEFKNLITKYL